MPCRDAVEPEPGSDGGEPAGTPALFVSDEKAEQVVGSGRQVIFTVYAAPANQVGAITFLYATANGTASAGTHYTSKSGTGTIPVGAGSVDIAVTVLEPSSAAGTTKAFTLGISAPSGATIADSSGTGTIGYATNPGPSIPDWEKKSYLSIPDDAIPVYDQFRSYNNVTGPDHDDPDCVTSDGAGCTGYAAAAMMSAIEYKVRGNRRVGFQARKILTDSGFSVGGSTWYDFYVHKQLTQGVGASAAGALSCDGRRRTLDKIIEISDEVSVGNTAARWADLKNRIKKRIVLQHCVYMSSSFYGGTWDTSGVEAYFYLRKPSSWSTTKGHSWILIGWNDNVTVKGRNIGGAFRVQSSHGRAWGDGGRAWLPYTHILESYPGGAGQRQRTGSMGDPWFRFFFPVA